MLKYFNFPLFILCLFILSCAPDDEKESASPAKTDNRAQTQVKDAIKKEGTRDVPAKAVRVEQGELNAAPPETESSVQIGEMDPEELKPVSEEEYEWADRMLFFTNKARNDLEQTLENSATSIHESAKNYLETWHLGKAPKIVPRKSIKESMKAPSALFSPEEEKILANSLDSMDKALGDMIKNYNELKKYVADDSIHDDGKKGSELGREIDRNYEKFSSARRSWLETVEARAQEAEEKFLRTHPLQRQIAGARTIFAQFREIAAEINKGGQNSAVLTQLRQTIEKIIADCARPPFNASPGLERQYKQFLNGARQYCRTLDRAIAEGMHGAQKREINDAVAFCRKSYNEFVRSANFLTSQLPFPGHVGQNQPENGDANRTAN